MRRSIPVARVLSLCLSFLFLLLPAFSLASDAIGVVSTSAGHAVVQRNGKILPAAAGTRLQAGDILSTGSDGSMGMILHDNSTLSIGPGSNLAIEKFLFSPAEGKYDLLVRLTRGTMACLSGLIGKLAPEKARFETPVASIGIRGTRFAVRIDDPASR